MSGKVTLLEVQKHNKERVNVYLDEEFAFSLNVVDAAHLHKGQFLSDHDITALRANDKVVQAFEHAVRFLAPRPRSITEIRRRLAQKGYADAVLDKVIERLQALNYVDDLAFARFWVENRERFNPRSKTALRFELLQKGIADDIITQVLADVDSEGLAYQAAHKKTRLLRGKDRKAVRESLSSFLVRRGFGYDVVRTVVDRIISEMEADPESESLHDED